MVRFVKSVLLVGFATIATAQPVFASASCWDQKTVSAARIRDLQSRLMVATLRCRAMGVDVFDAYNGFVRANRATIQSANDVLKAKFASDYGQSGQTHYDRFTTALANAYGGDATTYEICYGTKVMAEEAVRTNGNFERLIAIQDRVGGVPSLPGGVCTVHFASRP